ncbi:MAG: type I glyceraldehyde-3-phosphate dehydrogenase [bacterium]
MEKIKIGINGFGRIGRSVFRLALENEAVEVVGINDLMTPSTLAHLLKYDSVHGIFNADVDATDNSIIVNGREIKVSSEKDPSALPWKKAGVQVALECTGLFRTKETAEKHIEAGAEKVLISAPGKDVDFTVVLGVNDSEYDIDRHHVISNASCTTNCYAPITWVLHKHWGIKKGCMTTIHSYTNDQNILDAPHKKDMRRARAAAISMIPTSTGAAKAIVLVIPDLKGKLDGIAVRVPTANVSLVDAVYETEKNTSAQEINEMMKKYAEKELFGVLEYSDIPLVSSDFNGNPASSILDAENTKVMGGNQVKLLSWYDNEWGYSARLIDVTANVLLK